MSSKSSIPVGRDADFERIEGLWEAGRVRVLSIVGGQGSGKSTLARAVYQKLAGQVGGDRSFDWSTTNQASTLEGYGAWNISLMLREASMKLDVRKNLGAGRLDNWVQGTRLAQSVLERGGLLLLDNVDPLRTRGAASDACAGFDDPGAAALLTTLAEGKGDGKGICIVTTQEPLGRFVEEHKDRGSVVEIPLGPLEPEFGGELLRRQKIRGSNPQAFADVSAFFGGNPLALRLAAGYAHEKSPRRPDLADVYDIPESTAKGALGKLDQLLDKKGMAADRELVRLMGVFDCPADQGALKALLSRGTRYAHSLADVFRPGGAAWERMIKRMRVQSNLIESGFRAGRSLDVHQLVRNYGAWRLREENPRAWKALNRELGKYLVAEAETFGRGDEIKRISYLYSAVIQFCQGEDFERAFDVYWKSIQNRDAQVAVNKHGVIAPEFLAPFFRDESGPTWDIPASKLKDGSKRAILTGEIAHSLWHCARMDESLQAYNAAASANERLRVANEPRKNPLDARMRLAEVQRRAAETAMIHGDPGKALGFINLSVRTVKRREDGERADAKLGDRLSACLATLARILELRGEAEAADKAYGEAREASPRLMTRTIFGLWSAESLIEGGRVEQAREIARGVLNGDDKAGLPKIDEAYGYLVLGLADRAEGKFPEARDNLGLALDRARLARQQPHLANILLTVADLGVLEALRAMRDGGDWALRLRNDVEPMLAEARFVVRPETSRNRLGLYLGDYHIVLARRDLVRGRLEEARENAARANRLTSKKFCWYGRRWEQVGRLQRIVEAFGPLRGLAVELRERFQGNEDILTSALKRQYDCLMGTEREDTKRTRAGKGEGSLDAAVLSRVGLDPESAEALAGRVREALRPLIAEVASIKSEFGVGTGEGEVAGLVWSLVERHVRGALEDGGENLGGVSAVSDRRTMGVWEASQRTGISTGYLTTLARRGIIGDKVGTRYQFSEKELDDHIRSPRKRGRPPKKRST